MGIRIEKLKDEWYALKVALKDSVQKRNWKKPQDWFHFYVDLYVENFRNAPYFWGHVAAILLPVVLIEGAKLWITSG